MWVLILLWGLVFSLVILLIIIIANLEKKIKPLGRKSRIVELTKKDGTTKYIIQQQNKILRNWFDVYNYRTTLYGLNSENDLTFGNLLDAKYELNKLIEDCEKYVLSQKNSKVIKKRVIK